MFKLFNFFKGKQPSTTENNVFAQTSLTAQQLADVIKKVIRVFIEHPEYDDQQMTDAITRVTKEKRLALALYFFIPEALCRIIINEVSYPDTFIVYKSENHSITYAYTQEVVYEVVVREVGSNISGDHPAYREELTNILKHSATFDALNNALNGGADLKNLEIGPCVVYDIQ